MGLILLDVLVNSRLSPYFLDARNLSRTSSDFMEIGLMMLPMVFIIITGNVDLSVASNLGMSASFMGLLYNNGVNIWSAAWPVSCLGTTGWHAERLSDRTRKAPGPGGHARHLCLLSRHGLCAV